MARRELSCGCADDPDVGELLERCPKHEKDGRAEVIYDLAEQEKARTEVSAAVADDRDAALGYEWLRRLIQRERELAEQVAAAARHPGRRLRPPYGELREVRNQVNGAPRTASEAARAVLQEFDRVRRERDLLRRELDARKNNAMSTER